MGQRAGGSRSIRRAPRHVLPATSWPQGDPEALSPDQRETVDAILQSYGTKGAQWLSEQTHGEQPWQDARAGLAPGRRSSAHIDGESMRRFYARELRIDRGPHDVVERP